MRIKNGLVVAVVLLFVGVTVQPAIADNPINSTNSKDDCDICPYVSKLKELGKYQESSDKITTLREMNQILKPDYPYPIICNILLILMLPFAFIEGIATLIEYRINPDSPPLLWYLLLPFIVIGEMGVMFLIVLMVALNCIEIHPML